MDATAHEGIFCGTLCLGKDEFYSEVNMWLPAVVPLSVADCHPLPSVRPLLTYSPSAPGFGLRDGACYSGQTHRQSTAFLRPERLVHAWAHGPLGTGDARETSAVIHGRQAHAVWAGLELQRCTLWSRCCHLAEKRTWDSRMEELVWGRVAPSCPSPRVLPELFSPTSQLCEPMHCPLTSVIQGWVSVGTIQTTFTGTAGNLAFLSDVLKSIT